MAVKVKRIGQFYPLPEKIKQLSEPEVTRRINALKGELSEKLVILGHHYQRGEIVSLSDFRGDSLKLAQLAAQQKKASYIIFCGVTFMAESAAILCAENQKVIHPDFDAGCPMADMAPLGQVEQTWKELTKALGKRLPIPVTYINSTALVKAFCGRHQGLTCTSSNAPRIMEWALKKNSNVFFFPDEHLGRNTANRLGVKKEQIVLWDPALPYGGLKPDELQQAIVILWKGHCHVHTYLRPEDVHQARRKYPNCRIVVHPECIEEVVNLADANGSTEFIVKYVEQAKAGETIVIGTEINLVRRLSREHPDKEVYPLARSLCPNMYKINLYNLYWSLLNLGKINVVEVDKTTRRYARLALQRMLRLS